MIIGDKNLGAVFEANRPVTPWVFGRFCLIINGAEVGNFNGGTSFRVLLQPLVSLSKFNGMRMASRLVVAPLEESFVELCQAVRGWPDPIEVDKTINYHATEISRHDIEVFDGWDIFLLDSETKSRLIWRARGGVVQDVILPVGRLDQVLVESVRWLNDTFGEVFDAVE